jgi:hypothetical protein
MPGHHHLCTYLPALSLIISTDTGVSTPEPSATVLLAGGLLAVGLTVLGFKPNFGVSAS